MAAVRKEITLSNDELVDRNADFSEDIPGDTAIASQVVTAARERGTGTLTPSGAAADGQLVSYQITMTGAAPGSTFIVTSTATTGTGSAQRTYKVAERVTCI